jgi:putative ATP-dependent endonuclease of the OLD family
VKLVSFSIENFRSIKKTGEIKLADLSVLVGPNNEGKSNLLRALASVMEVVTNLESVRLLKGRVPFRVSRYVWGRDFPIDLQSSLPTGNSKFTLKFELSPQEVNDFVQAVGSKNNGNLGIEIGIGKSDPTFRVLKQGKAQKNLNKKESQIAEFIGTRIQFVEIPAIRTATVAQEQVEALIGEELRALENRPEYAAALKTILDIQNPVLEKIGADLTTTLKTFVADIRKAEIKGSTDRLASLFRRNFSLTIDDGIKTDLSRKGDGIQSLVTLALIKHSSELSARGKSLILAIEEPESHLHPKAIHEIRRVLNQLASKHQVIVTTHNPIFVNRANPSANVLVANNKAKPATSLAQIRDSLGVKSFDNMRNAEIVLLVEGEDDRATMEALLRYHSITLKKSLDSGFLTIDPLFSSSKLVYKLSQWKNEIFVTHALLDDDSAGRDGYNAAEKLGLIDTGDVNFTSAPGLANAELEDLFDLNSYSLPFTTRFGVDLTKSTKFRNNKDKWSDRVKATFKAAGKPWSDKVEREVKVFVATSVTANPKTAIHHEKFEPITNLIQRLESKIKSLSPT